MHTLVLRAAIPGVRLLGRLLIASALVACSNRDIYEAVQQNRQLECQRYPDTRYEDCMERAGGSYEDYASELEPAATGTRPAGTVQR